MTDPSSERSFDGPLSPRAARRPMITWEEIQAEILGTGESKAQDGVRLRNHMLHLAWRCAREIATACGYISAHTVLAQMPLRHWHEFDENRRGGPIGEYDNRSYKSILSSSGIPCLPPKVEPKAYSSNVKPKFLDVIRYILKRFSIRDTKYAGAVGWMVDPNQIDKWPSAQRVISYEEELCEKCLKQMVGGISIQKMRKFQNKYALFNHEMGFMVGASRSLAMSYVEGYDRELNRAMMSIRVDDLIERARDSGMLRLEFQGLKLMSTIQRLTDTETDPIAGKYVDVIEQEEGTMSEGGLSRLTMEGNSGDKPGSDEIHEDS